MDFFLPTDSHPSVGHLAAHTQTEAMESQNIKGGGWKKVKTNACTCARTHTHTLWKPFKPLRPSIVTTGGRGGGKESHEMIPDMTDHGAAPLELSDINTFLPGCGQVRQAGGRAVRGGDLR